MKDISAVILVGGEGTRLRPLTLHTPKALVPVVNKPLLSYIIEWFKYQHIYNLIFSVCYQPDKLKSVFGSGSKYGVHINYIVEKEPLGTGGAIKKAERFFKNTTIVINGDVLFDLDLASMLNYHRSKKSKITIALTPVEDPTAYGLVKIDKSGRIIGFLEKPTWDEVGRQRNINAGVYIIEPSILKYIKPNKICSLERNIFPELLLKKESFYGFVAKSMYWIDLGTHEKYRQAHQDILEGKLTNTKYFKKFYVNNVAIGVGTKLSKKTELYGPVVIGENCKIENKVTLNEFTVIGNRCHIAENVYLERCIIWDDVIIESGARLTGCIIGKNSHIGSHSSISDGVVLGDNNRIQPYSYL